MFSKKNRNRKKMIKKKLGKLQNKLKKKKQQMTKKVQGDIALPDTDNG